MNAFEKLRLWLGWCPSVNSKIYKSNQPIYYTNPSISPTDKIAQIRPIQSGNVIFPADGSLLTLYSVIGFTLLFNLSRHLDHPVLFMGGIAMGTLYYFLAVKTFQASIRIDENGVHYKSFRLKDITLNFRDIKSIKSVKWDSNNYSKKIWVLLAVFILILALSVLFKEWTVIVVAAPLLPLILMLEREQEKRYHGLDTQIYIESGKNKWWYELSPYYSVITDKNTADRMRASIEQYMGGTHS